MSQTEGSYQSPVSPDPADPADPPSAVSTGESPAAGAEAIPAQPIVARAGRYYRSMRYLFVIAMLAMAAWFAYDGLVGWPGHNARFDELSNKSAELAMREQSLPEGSPEREQATIDRAQAADALTKHGQRKSDFDIMTQKVLAVALPPLAIAFLVFVLNRSRGEYRLEHDILYAPGHPPVPVANITSIDSSVWDKKGIASICYSVPSRSGVIKLDDFIYDRKPIDDIYKVIKSKADRE